MVRLRPEEEGMRDQISEDVAKFLKEGGRIESVPAGRQNYKPNARRGVIKPGPKPGTGPRGPRGPR
jgi:hypothetical protein